MQYEYYTQTFPVLSFLYLSDYTMRLKDMGEISYL